MHTECEYMPTQAGLVKTAAKEWKTEGEIWEWHVQTDWKSRLQNRHTTSSSVPGKKEPHSKAVQLPFMVPLHQENIRQLPRAK